MDAKRRINWVDGMLINKAHFKGMEDYLLSNIYTTNRLLISDNYGIIPAKALETDYPGIKLSIDASEMKYQKIVIENIEFRAISPAGTLLEISNDCFQENGDHNYKSGSSIIVEVNEKIISHGEPLYLILLSQPFETKGYGQSISKEEPLRHSFCKPISELKCVRCNSDEENLTGPNFFPIAKIKIINHRLEIDRNYLPPCVTIFSHAGLREKGLSLFEGLVTMNNNINTFIQNNQNESERNVVYLRHVFTLLYQRLIEITEYFNEERKHLNPWEIIRAIRITALLFKKNLLCNSDAHAFFTENWNSKYGISFNSYSNAISSLKDRKHYDIVDSIEVCQKLLNDYLIRITAIDNYGKQANETNPDLIL